MKYLLDTNKIINYMKGNQGTVEEIIKLFDDGLAVSVLSVAEIIYGASKSDRAKTEVGKFEKFIKETGIHVLNVDKEIAEIYGQKRAELEKKKTTSLKQSFIFDILIAATSIKYKLVLVTENTRDFQSISNLELLK